MEQSYFLACEHPGAQDLVTSREMKGLPKRNSAMKGDSYPYMRGGSHIFLKQLCVMYAGRLIPGLITEGRDTSIQHRWLDTDKDHRSDD